MWALVVWALATSIQNLTFHKDKTRRFKRRIKKKWKACAQVEPGSLKPKSSMCITLNFQKVHTYFFATRLMNLKTFLHPLTNKPSYVVCQVSKYAGKSIFCVYTLKKWSFFGEVSTCENSRQKINCTGKYLILMCDVLSDFTLTFTVKCNVDLWTKKVHVVLMTKNLLLY